MYVIRHVPSVLHVCFVSRILSVLRVLDVRSTILSTVEPLSTGGRNREVLILGVQAAVLRAASRYASVQAYNRPDTHCNSVVQACKCAGQG